MSFKHQIVANNSHLTEKKGKNTIDRDIYRHESIDSKNLLGSEPEDDAAEGATAPVSPRPATSPLASSHQQMGLPLVMKGDRSPLFTPMWLLYLLLS